MLMHEDKRSLKISSTLYKINFFRALFYVLVLLKVHIISSFIHQHQHVATTLQFLQRLDSTLKAFQDDFNKEDTEIAHLYIAGLGSLTVRNDKDYYRNSDGTNEIELLQDAVINTLYQYSTDDSKESNISVKVHCVKEESLEEECDALGVHGVLGRVALLDISNLMSSVGISIDDGSRLSLNTVMDGIKITISSYVDEYVQEGLFNQPILLSLTSTRISLEATNYSKLRNKLVDHICDEVKLHRLCFPIIGENEQESGLPRTPRKALGISPSFHAKLDGAWVDSEWDTSDIYVFDYYLNDSLKRDLRQVLLNECGSTNNALWDDSQGPNPSRWERGGLDDTFFEGSVDKSEGSCWGLTADAVDDICFGNHNAIRKFEQQLCYMFPGFKVCKLPESVFGQSISPMTGNAATSIDTFSWHIDADPALVPPSPWADIYGRYPNRKRGKPRFVSCLIYVNDDWSIQKYGAPTRFLDPPTGQELDIDPVPGRILIMDQDITHSVVAPKSAAGMKPRYSLVWKLILHPLCNNQDMTLFCMKDAGYPDVEYVGSAVTKSAL